MFNQVTDHILKDTKCKRQTQTQKKHEIETTRVSFSTNKPNLERLLLVRSETSYYI